MDMSNPHKHKDMIIAKAENMDLIVFYRESNRGSEVWYERRQQDKTNFNPIIDYFLCLPKHKQACLHWLDGGEVDWGNTNHEVFDWYPKDNIGINDLMTDIGYFTDESFLIRIRPRKEKRHLYVSREGATTYAKKTQEEARREVVIMGGSFEIWKHHEIEVEV